MNFATWGVNPYKTRQTQDHIGISIGGQDGNCWDTTNDVDKVIAAIDDISKCFYVHQQKVVLAGYSSGGILAYRLGPHAVGEVRGDPHRELRARQARQPTGAAWKINVAHIAHTGDAEFPSRRREADWAKLEAAGIPLQKTRGRRAPTTARATTGPTGSSRSSTTWKAP